MNARTMGRLLVVALACLPARAVLANGGGYAFGVKFTGSVAPFQASGAEHVRILEEHLEVTLRRTDAAVAVHYTMQNRSAQPVRVKFGFPVETTVAEEEYPESEPGYDEYRRKDLLASIQRLRGYSVTAGGDPVPAAFQVESFSSGKLKPFPGSRALKGIGGWMVSEVTFPPGAPVALEIRYTADHFGGESSISDDSWVAPLWFKYRLSTGAVWNGPIEKGTVTLLADGIAADEVVIKAPGKRFVRDGERWTWHFENLEPTLADDLSVLALPGYFVPGAVGDYRVYEAPARPFPRYLQRGGEKGPWGEASQRFTATASSSLAPARDHDFGPEHLAEETASYPWAEGAAGPGTGEWVELAPAKARPLLALGITSGFPQEELFKKNGRPSRVEVLLNDEHRFVASLGDTRGQQFIPVVGYAKPVSKIRITVLDVFPGSRWADTCLARVVLYDLLPRALEVHGSR